ncbi:hypothetical protein PCI56_07830 [Plesiomonas shigelloides subsp. oncorhynchi]|nr:hypothetical protein [Plesiomonas shigelloides]
MVDLERQMRACFDVHCKIPAIMLTLGTTDTFGVDRIKPVYDLRNRLCDEYDIAVKPHIHADAAVGWSMLFFLDYDFDRNPLEINESTLAGFAITLSVSVKLNMPIRLLSTSRSGDMSRTPPVW